MFLLSDWSVIFLLEFKKLGKWGLLLAQLILRIRRRLWRERRWRPSEMSQLNLITNCFRNAAVQPKEHVSPDNPKNRRINKWARRIESKLRRPIRAFQEATAADRLRLPLLQSRMKLDPEGYEAELLLIYGHFESSLHLFLQQSALSSSSDPVVSKDLGDLTMFLAHMTPYYPRRLAEFPH
ncbi:hypothetical protein HPP92_006872 [Vanilla planifolia]|uniref:Protein SDA1 n=1 Tax=Vanilla planifolia TaxID=51239 RepID=A0A835R941_VANPL|nr:hypothetical protein HPP92_006872 [Vanilla planifolia]